MDAILDDEPILYNTYCCSLEKKMSINVTSLIIAMFGVLKIILSIALHEILGNVKLFDDKKYRKLIGK